MWCFSLLSIARGNLEVQHRIFIYIYIHIYIFLDKISHITELASYQDLSVVCVFL